MVYFHFVSLLVVCVLMIMEPFYILWRALTASGLPRVIITIDKETVKTMHGCDFKSVLIRSFPHSVPSSPPSLLLFISALSILNGRNSGMRENFFLAAFRAVLHKFRELQSQESEQQQ